jgi:DNA modification methylase
MKTVENAPSVKNGKWNKTKFNENGKNPGNVWTDIKPLTYHSKELERESALNTVQKPIVLFDRLIKASSNEDDVILDPFCGTGSSLVSAKKLGRKYIGIEKDKTNFDICIKRTSGIDLGNL